jgi:hypothetical protein
MNEIENGSKPLALKKNATQQLHVGSQNVIYLG